MENNTKKIAEKENIIEVRNLYKYYKTGQEYVHALDGLDFDIKKGELQEVPMNICHNNMGYKYPHNYTDNFVKQKYMNKKKKYYKPGNNKNEKLIAEKLSKLWDE